MDNGQTAETAAIGREGMIGATACIGATRGDILVFCQIPPSECLRWSAAEFAAEVARGGPLRDAVHDYIRGMLLISAQQSACNALHPADERLARWLLICHDAVGTDEFSLTHEFLATMLGVRRATVTVTAGSLQSAGIISYRHGQVAVLDRPRLEEAACECYRAIRGA